MRMLSVQMAQALLDETGEKLALSAVSDMWMFGMLVYEVVTGETYWPKSMKDKEACFIRCLC